MRIYVATKYPMKARAAEVGQMLEKQGHEITHKWWLVEEGFTFESMPREAAQK